MARARIDLNRFRKIYPQRSKSPRMFSAELRPYRISFSSSQSEEQLIADYVSPVVVVTSDENYNVWVQSIIRNSNGIGWKVTIESSTQITGTVYMHVGEAYIP